MGQIAHFGPPEWLIQSSPPPIEGHHRQLDNQCKDPMDNNKDCRVGQLTTSRVDKFIDKSKIASNKLQVKHNCIHQRNYLSSHLIQG